MPTHSTSQNSGVEWRCAGSTWACSSHRASARAALIAAVALYGSQIGLLPHRMPKASAFDGGGGLSLPILSCCLAMRAAMQGCSDAGIDAIWSDAHGTYAVTAMN